MELVNIAEIELNRPQSAVAQGVHNGSNPISGLFTVADKSVETLRAKVIGFAEGCGVPRSHLMSLQQVPGHHYSVTKDVLVFDIPNLRVLYSVPYAYCRVFLAMKIDNRFFKLDEIVGVSGEVQT
jgi:hypothetical protein